MSYTVDCLVIGAGVIGLAVARRLAADGREVVVLEAEPQIGMHTSSRNSEVVHAGIYYPTGSLKAALCVAGKAALFRYCERKGVPCTRLGKLIVANGEVESRVLRGVFHQGRQNGVADLEWLESSRIRELESSVRADAAILSPSTATIDSHALMLALQADLEAAGGTVLLHHRVVRIAANDQSIEIDCEAEEAATFAVRCRALVNATGPWASMLARKIRGLEAARIPETRFAKGHYFGYSKRSPFEHLVYPVPTVGGLGIHATNDLSGRVRFGPDVEWVDQIDYDFDASRRDVFASAISKYFPSIEPEQLSPDYVGIRPKLYRQGQPSADFLIQGPRDHGIDGLINLLGIESPGLTSCLAIADRVQQMLG